MVKLACDESLLKSMMKLHKNFLA